MFGKNKEKKEKTSNHKHSVEHAKEDIKDLEKRASSRYQKVRSFFKETYNKRIMYMYIVCALGVTFLIEVLARGSLLKGLYYVISSPYVFIVNALIVLMTLSFTLLLRRRFFGMALISLIWIIFGVSNCILMANRVTPFTAVDLMLIDSAFDVLNKYFDFWQIVLVIIALVAAIAGIVYLCFKAPKVNHKIQYVRNIAAIIIIWAVGFGAIQLGLGSGLIPRQFGNLRDSYTSYGFVYCFSNSLVNTGVKKPKNYSEEAIRALINGKTYKKAKSKPNILFLQLESFFDLKKVKNIKLSQDPVPTFTKFKKKYPSGYLNVPVVGAGTVNTEFETMTGMNMDDFGPGEYPFKTILNKKSCESIAFNLRPYGYTCHAVHNNTATFYGRNHVFANLGYDTFTSIENMDEVEKTQADDDKAWAKDKCLTKYIMDCLKSTKKQDFIYTISVQGHGAYPTEDMGSAIKVKGIEDEALTHQYEYFATQTNEMDAFVDALTKRLKKFKEKTILVMYGDHLPSLGITANNLVNGNVYQTEYIIWSNFKTKYTNEDLEAYQLEPKILKDLHITEGEINNYSQLHRKDKDQKAYLEGLHKLEYDQLYGKNLANKGKNPYKPTDLKFGLNDVTVNSINPMHNDVGTIYIYGNNFTPYSKVYINDEKFDTIYIDRTTLIVQNPELKAGDAFVVKQQNSDTHILSETKKYSYAAEETNARKIKETKAKKKKHKKK
ncbi:MAG: sulfatase-like hydrolase/transferase [Eubacterium sp.]|nr:sulfatase-like hydrolase/transferase [Eubacterium sp.]